MNLSSKFKFNMVLSRIMRPLNLASNTLSCTSFSMLVKSQDLRDMSPFLVRRIEDG